MYAGIECVRDVIGGGDKLCEPRIDVGGSFDATATAFSDRVGEA